MKRALGEETGLMRYVNDSRTAMWQVRDAEAVHRRTFENATGGPGVRGRRVDR